MTDENQPTEDLPRELIAQLKAADRRQALITARVDRALRQQAAEQFADRRAGWRRPAAWTAMAASLLLALFIVQLRDPAMVADPDLYADLNQSGQIDIADVLVAARRGGPEAPSQAQLDAFALRVVTLRPDGEAL